MVILSLMETFNKWGENLKSWVIANNRNPIFWGSLFVLGILIFFWTYNALNKHH